MIRFLFYLQQNCLVSLVDRTTFPHRWQLYDAVCCLTAGFNHLRLEKGARVCIQAADTIDLLLCFLAAIAADLVPVPMLNSLIADEMSYIFQHSQAKLFLHLNNHPLKIQLPAQCRQINLREYEKLSKTAYRDMQPATQANDAAFIFYTSGSSGKPKGVLHAQHAILGRIPSLEWWLTLQRDDNVLQTDNLCWTYCMFTGFLDPLSVGATAVFYNPANTSSMAEDVISGETWLQLIETYKITVIASTPDIYNVILKDTNLHRYKIPSLRMAGSAGMPLPDSTQQCWHEVFHMPIYISLGMTEISTFICTGPAIPYRQGSIGKIQPGRKVTLLPVDSGFIPVPAQQIGMLAIHKNELGFMLGYLGESHNDSRYYRGDWFLTQDLLSMDDDGYLTYFGRTDTILKVDGGFRVSLMQVESVIKSCSGVKDVACGAVDDDDTKSEMLAAYIIHEEPGEQAAQQISQYLEEHLNDYQMPRHLYFVISLPYSARGKLLRSKLPELCIVYKYSYGSSPH